MKTIIALIFLCFSTTLTITAHPDGYVPNDSLYRASFQQIKEMLEGKRTLNFKKAVFITENAYLNGGINRESFETNIQILALLAQEIARQEHLKYQYEDSINIKKNWGITRVLTGSFYLKMYGHSVEWRPTSYNFEDPLGEKDWTNTFVSNLIWTSKGNCHSLPFLYKILAEELGAEAFLSLAPSHLYLQIPCKNRKIGSYNLELTSKSHPTTGLIVANSYISLEAIQAGLYMNKLSLKESIALTLLDLAQGYQKKFPKVSENFILECIKTVLEHFPNCVNAQLLKVEILAKKYQRTKDVLTFAELNKTCNWLISNGYDEMPKEMYAEGLTSSNPYEHLSLKYQTANKEGLTPYSDAKTATVGNGKYLETHSTETLEYIGSVIYNTQTKQVETIQDYQRIGDLTMNPSLVGRFLSVDPLTSGYPSWTPYAFAMNRPIDGIDLDGLEWSSSKEGNEVTIKLHMTVVLKSETIKKLTIAEQNKLLSDYTIRAQSIINDNLRDFKGQDGLSFKFELTYERLSKETKLTEEHVLVNIQDTEFTVDEDGTATFTGGVTYLGGFQGRIRVNYAAVNSENPNHVILTVDFGQKLIHEILHKAGLLHPWDSNAEEDIQQEKLIEKIGAYEAKKVVKDNVMNSEDNILVPFKGTGGEKMTKNQKENFTNNALKYTDEKQK